MDVAVTGSTGLIGTALCRRLEADGHTVVRVVRRPVAAGEAALRWDPEAGTIDAASLEGMGAVVHLAGAGIGDKRWTPERKRVILESRTKGTALAGRHGGRTHPPARRVGERVGDRLLRGPGRRGPDRAERPRRRLPGGICTAWEAATHPAADAGIRVATIRTGIVLSVDGGALAKLLPLFKLGLGGRFGSGRQWWSWITLDDEVGAILHLLDHPVSGPVNLTAPHPDTNAGLTKALGHVLGRPSFLAVPAFGPKLVVGGELAEALLFTSARVLPTVLESSGFTFAHPDVESALRHVLGRERRRLRGRIRSGCPASEHPGRIPNPRGGWVSQLYSGNGRDLRAAADGPVVDQTGAMRRLRTAMTSTAPTRIKAPPMRTSFHTFEPVLGRLPVVSASTDTVWLTTMGSHDADTVIGPAAASPGTVKAKVKPP